MPVPTLTVTERVLTYTHNEQRLWNDYLHICRHAHNYEQIEPWAWSLLQQQLRHNGKRKQTTPTPPPRAKL